MYRGRIVSWDDARPMSTAMAVQDGRVVALGGEAEALAGDADEREDFGAAYLFPGFHDAHCHTTAFGLSLGQLDVSSPPVSSLDDVYAVVAGGAAAADSEGRRHDWVIGSGYDQNKLGGQHPSRAALDAAAGDHPVWLTHTSGHMCVVNSATLALIGPRLDEPIEGGVVLRDPAGAPTGLLQERAQGLVRDLVLPRSLESIAQAIGDAHDRYLSEGITSVCDAGIGGGWIGQSPLELAAYQLARDTGRLKVRSTVMLSSDLLEPIVGHADDFPGAVPVRGLPAGLRSGLGDDRLRLGPVKVFSDGSLIGRTCWMEHGFDDDPANTGFPQADPERLRSLIIGAHLAGWQVATHAIGDAAVRFVLDCYEEALSLVPRDDHRHRIEHCGITPSDSLQRLVDLGVVPVPQGRFIGEIGDGMLAALGPERAAYAYRLRSFLEAGIVLPGSSDRPVVDGRPLLGIADMVRRSTQSGAPFAEGEALTAEQAMRAYSAGSAHAERTERERGSLRLGQLADFVVLADDPRAVDPIDIASVPVIATSVGGRIAHDAR